MTMKLFYYLSIFLFLGSLNISAQKVTSQDPEKRDSLAQTTRLQFGGYGEAVMIRNFYSDNYLRYSNSEKYKDAKSHGRFDLPHVVFYVGYNFGRGWSMGTEIEFEHGGTESAMEIEEEEGGEYESEVERGGEIALEQFWIQKSFNPYVNLRMGHLIVPVGLTNGSHTPTEFFGVYRPEGESTILPCTWHETGVSIWGRTRHWRYEVLFLPGLDSDRFNDKEWIKGGAGSPYEFKIGNSYAGAVRIDNYSVRGLRIGVSGYMGNSFRNSLMPSEAEKDKEVTGTVAIGSVDFHYDAHHWIARGHFDYGHLSDADRISSYNKGLRKDSPSPQTNVASAALAAGVEAGYDLFSQVRKLRENDRKLYLFGRYEYYDSMYQTTASIGDQKWCERQRVAVGLNYFPMKSIVVKAEYSNRILKSSYNNEPSLAIGIAYSGFFTR